MTTALGNNAHIFAKPARRDQLKWCLDTAVGMVESMLVFRFTGGGHLSIEFIEDAPDDSRGQVFTIAPGLVRQLRCAQA